MYQSLFVKMKRTAAVIILSALALQTYAEDNTQIPATIQEGVILHCFNWKFSDITANLDLIKQAGFTTVQTSPAQTNYPGTTGWNTLYRPRDTEVGPNTLGNAENLRALCEAAHQRGMKVIVDVVANHTDGSLTYVAPFWQDMSLYHTWGPVQDWNNRPWVINGEIGMKDLKTEDWRVQQKFKEYVAKLKACGVDGCRWDAAKHIGLPSEGDQFWANVPDQTMYNYGEILDKTAGDDSRLLPEYLKYMSITDNNYSTHSVLEAAKRGQACQNGYGCYSTTYSTDKLVYWGESHDTYCNNGDASDGVDQSVVDRAYAIAASHNHIPALYFSRPAGRGSASQAGVRGSLHFQDKCVAEVNKFHNLMNKKPDYYSANGSVASVTRKDGGAIVVNFRGKGDVNVANGGRYAVTGEYTDHVSGNKFYVTATTITGRTNYTGIAVLYKDRIIDDDTLYTPRVEAGETSCFLRTNEKATPTIWAWDANNGNANYTGNAWPGKEMQRMGKAKEGGYIYKWIYTGNKGGMPTGVIFCQNGQKTAATDLAFVNHGYYDGQKCLKVIGDTIVPPTKKVVVYVKASTAPYLYVWNDKQQTLNGNWPGTRMNATKNVGGVTYYYKEFDAEHINIILNNGRGSQTADINNVTGSSYFDYNGYSLYAKKAKAHTTAIQEITTGQESTPVYNLNGQRVNPQQRGILVKGGKKIAR